MITRKNLSTGNRSIMTCAHNDTCVVTSAQSCKKLASLKLKMLLVHYSHSKMKKESFDSYWVKNLLCYEKIN